MHRTTYTAVVVGPNALLRDGISRILRAADFRIACSVSDLGDAPIREFVRDDPILCVIDAGDDVDGGIRSIEIIKSRHPSARIVLLAHDDRLMEMVSAFRAGASAYFRNDSTSETFTKSIELVMLGETILPSIILSAMCSNLGNAVCPLDSCDEHHSIGSRSKSDAFQAGAPPSANETEGIQPPPAQLLDPELQTVPRLSAREQTILLCLAVGDSNKVIARKLGIAEATVKVHVKAILRKISVHNRTQAAVWAMSQNPPIPLSATNGSAEKDSSPASLETLRTLIQNVSRTPRMN